mmetsp:Transcript_14109/g.45194  ORF Transcript_14109/g.45194 Transcript_14109/m.45194 type:complete len:537 (-) Transcript_14109:45-1655(-)
MAGRLARMRDTEAAWHTAAAVAAASASEEGSGDELESSSDKSDSDRVDAAATEEDVLQDRPADLPLASTRASLRDVCREFIPVFLANNYNVSVLDENLPAIRGWRTIAERALLDPTYATRFAQHTSDPDELSQTLHAQYRAIKQHRKRVRDRDEKRGARSQLRWNEDQRSLVQALGRRLRTARQHSSVGTRLFETLEHLRGVAQSANSLTEEDRQLIVKSCDECLEEDGKTGRKKRRASPWAILAKTHLFRDRTSRAIQSRVSYYIETSGLPATERRRQGGGRPVHVHYLRRERYELHFKSARPTRDLPDQLKALVWQMPGFGPVSFAVYGALNLYFCMAYAGRTTPENEFRDAIVEFFASFAPGSGDTSLVDRALTKDLELANTATPILPVFSYEMILFFITGFPRANPGRRQPKAALAREALRHADRHDNPQDVSQRRMGAYFPFLGATPLITPNKLSVPMGRKPSPLLCDSMLRRLEAAREEVLAGRSCDDGLVVSYEEVESNLGISEPLSNLAIALQAGLLSTVAWQRLQLI